MEMPTNIELRGVDFGASDRAPLIRTNLHRCFGGEFRGRRCLRLVLRPQLRRGQINLRSQLSGNSYGVENKGKLGIIRNCHDIYNGTRLRGLRLRQTSRGTVETHSIQINRFPRLQLESAIRAEWADLGLDVGGKERDLPELATQGGEGNRTLVSSLEGYSFTIKL